MYDPQSVAHEIRYPWVKHKTKMKDGSVSKYRASFITIWHVDPEKPGTCNRRDDSCGWFDRGPGPYADAVAYVLKDKSFMHDVSLTLARKVRMPYPFYEGISEEQLYGNRLVAGDALALCLMIATELELRRWWNGQKGKEGACRNWRLKAFTKHRDVAGVATRLALCSFDNLSHVETPESAVRLIAAALNRHFRPWYKHPRWHVWHWKFQIHPLQQFNRWAFVRCDHCKGMFRWNEGVIGDGSGKRIWHDKCDQPRRDAYLATPDGQAWTEKYGHLHAGADSVKAQVH